MKLSLIAWMTLASLAGAQASMAEGGVGVKNGGTAIQCPQLGSKVEMIEVSEARAEAGDALLNLSDRDQFFSAVVARLQGLHNYDGSYLALMLQAARMSQGPSSQWRPTQARVPTILGEDRWNTRNTVAVDWESGTIQLRNGCKLIPISYLSGMQFPNPLSPEVIPGRLELLDEFNGNVLEMHEAFYSIFVARNPTLLDVLPTRDLGRVVIESKSTDAELNRAIENFLRPYFPGSAPLGMSGSSAR